MSKMKRIDEFITNAMEAADLLQGYVDHAENQIDNLEDSEIKVLERELEKMDTDGPEEAGAKAILLKILQLRKEED